MHFSYHFNPQLYIFFIVCLYKTLITNDTKCLLFFLTKSLTSLPKPLVHIQLNDFVLQKKKYFHDMNHSYLVRKKRAKRARRAGDEEEEEAKGKGE